jgi:NAD/NADP transhydrogenase beta subunit
VNDQLIVNGDVVGDGGDFTYVYTATQRSFVMSINNTGFGANATFQICPRLEIGPIDTGL